MYHRYLWLWSLTSLVLFTPHISRKESNKSQMSEWRRKITDRPFNFYIMNFGDVFGEEKSARFLQSRHIHDNNVFLLNIFSYGLQYRSVSQTDKVFVRATRQLNSIYTVASLGFTFISSMIVARFKCKEQQQYTFVSL